MNMRGHSSSSWQPSSMRSRNTCGAGALMKEKDLIVQAIYSSLRDEPVCPCDELLHEGWRLVNRDGLAAQFPWKTPGTSTCAGGGSNLPDPTDT